MQMMASDETLPWDDSDSECCYSLGMITMGAVVSMALFLLLIAADLMAVLESTLPVMGQ